jgi:hypothetical protein
MSLPGSTAYARSRTHGISPPLFVLVVFALEFIFRGPFQVRFDMSLAKQFQLKERFQLRFEADAFNIFNHPNFDTPNNNVTFFSNFSGPTAIPSRADAVPTNDLGTGKVGRYYEGTFFGMTNQAF